MIKRPPFLVSSVLILSLLLINSSFANETQGSEDIPTPQQMLEKVRESLPPFSYTQDKDDLIPSLTDPTKKLRRLEVTFLSQIIDGIKMNYKAAIYLPIDPETYQQPERRGKVVIVTHRSFDESMEWNYVEPIVTRTDYPTMHLDARIYPQLPACFKLRETVHELADVDFSHL